MILVRHARSVVDPSVPPEGWALAPDAVDAAAALGAALSGDTVVASTERKAIDTAEALGRGPVETRDAFCEVTRPFYDERGALERHVAEWFGGVTVEGWESWDDAVARFDGGLTGRDRDGLIVVTHGTVLTAWLTSQGVIEDPLRFWSDLRMPDAWSLGPTLVRCR